VFTIYISGYKYNAFQSRFAINSYTNITRAYYISYQYEDIAKHMRY